MCSVISSPSFRLIPSGGFWHGFASVFDIGGNYFQYNGSATPEEADRRALTADMHAVGADLRVAFEQAKKQAQETP